MDFIASVYYYFKLGTSFDHRNQVSYLPVSACGGVQNTSGTTIAGGMEGKSAHATGQVPVVDLRHRRVHASSKKGTERIAFQEVAIANLPSPPSSSFSSPTSSSSSSSVSLASLKSDASIFTIKGVRICIVSDTHDRHHLLPSLPPCDIFFHLGDILMTSRMLSEEATRVKLTAFNEWIGCVPAAIKIVIGGNHDVALERLGIDGAKRLLSNCTYLCNELIEFRGLAIFATPFSTGRSENRAFQSQGFRADTEAHFQGLMSQGRHIDILVSHGPLSREISEGLRAKLHFWGHVHEYYGATLIAPSKSNAVSTSKVKDEADGDADNCSDEDQYCSTLSICACNMGAAYTMNHLPIIIDYNYTNS